jgi:hypothetical protein
VQTTTHQLTGARPIPAAPDYGKFGLGRRSTLNNNMLDNSSSEEEAFDTEELVQKFDWSSPRRRKKNSPSKEEANAVDIMDGMFISTAIVTYMKLFYVV